MYEFIIVSVCLFALIEDQGSPAPSLPERLQYVFHCDSEWHHPLPHPAAACWQRSPADIHLLGKLNPLEGTLGIIKIKHWKIIRFNIILDYKNGTEEDKQNEG